MSFTEELEKLCEQYPVVGGKATYGTAGFRGKPEELKHIMYRCGILATLRSYMLGCKAVGCMITASHNPSADNGIKMIDPSGQMMEQNFELYIQVMANCPNPSQYVNKICHELNPGEEVTKEMFANAVVMVGRDSRSSSPELCEILCDGVRALGAKTLDFGVVTTPELHFLVARANSKDREPDEVLLEEQYFNVVASHFMTFCQQAGINPEPSTKLLIDGSNGVGASKFQFFEPVFTMIGLTHEVRNTGKEVMDVLNEECGAEYVQKQRKFPRGFEVDEVKGVRIASLDGDADRIVYSSANEQGEIMLFDGDKIAVLFKRMIERLLLQLVKAFPTKGDKVLHLGVIQTAYTNGGAASIMVTPPEGLSLMDCSDIVYDYAIVKTGVKHLHAKAETYQVGLYFESNGHGTILVDFESLDEWAASKGCKESDEYALLRAFLQIFNQQTGDAITNLLAVEACLKYLGVSIDEWDTFYDEMPVVNRKIPLPRLRLKQIRPSNNDETQLIRPAEMQKEISSLLCDPENKERAFVRPSGTEDVLRVYVESRSVEDANVLADKVEALVRKYCAA